MTTLALEGWSPESAFFTPFSKGLTKPLAPVHRAYSELMDMEEPAWVELSRMRLENIQALELGWDGYRAGPIRRDVISYASAVLNRVMKARTPVPHIAPMAHSGVMIEWHTKGIDLEIEIERPGELWVSFENASANKECEDTLTSNLSKLQDWIDQITEKYRRN